MNNTQTNFEIGVMPGTKLSMAIFNPAERQYVNAWIKSKRPLRIVDKLDNHLVAEVDPFTKWNAHPRNIFYKYVNHPETPGYFLPCGQLSNYGNLKLYDADFAKWRDGEALIPVVSETGVFEIDSHTWGIWANSSGGWDLKVKADNRPEPSKRTKLLKNGKPTTRKYSYAYVATSKDKDSLKNLAEATTRLVGSENIGVVDAYKDAANFLKTYRSDLL